jgi:hypothetical protein
MAEGVYGRLWAPVGPAYTLALGDEGGLITPVSAWPNLILIPPDWLEPLPVGAWVDVIQRGEGQTSFLASRGVMLLSERGKHGLEAPYCGARLIKIAANTWVLEGELGYVIPQAYPASIRKARLEAVWDLQRGGTGPRGPYANGKWPGEIDDYLKPFFLFGNDGALWTNAAWFGSGATTIIQNYSFKGAPPIHIEGDTESGTVILQDCDTSCGVVFPCDINGNIWRENTGLKVRTLHCLYDGAEWTMGAGDFASEACRYKNQPNTIGTVGYDNPGGAVVAMRGNFVTGGGCAPAWNQHVELTPFVKLNPPTGPCAYVLAGNMIDVSQDGQPDVANWNSGWTGLESIGAYTDTEFTGNVAIGLTRVNANSMNPNVIGCVWAYGAGSLLRAGGNVMEPGAFGYGHNQTSGDLTRPVQTSPNWDFASGRVLVEEDFTLTEAA